MSVLVFDAIAYCQQMQAGGFSREQAETLAVAQQKALQEIAAAKDLVTRPDLQIELSRLKISLIKWVVGSTISLGAFLVAVIFGIFALLLQLAVFIQK